jgi:hypothetical protein
MPADFDSTNWSGEGDFTQRLVDWCAGQDGVALVRVEDAPSSRSDVEYNFISNEIYLQFHIRERVEQRRFLYVVPFRRTLMEKVMTLEQLESKLADDDELGAPDYADEGMIQYLHTERVVPHYQTKGYKLIELVRIYEVGTPSRA